MSDAKVDTSEHVKHFSEDGFWKKLQRSFKKIGHQTAEKALWLFYAGIKKDTPTWAKTTIFGALGYLIFPVDAIPDFIPAVGYADDAGVLAAALAAVAFYIDDEVKAKASDKLKAWFG